MSNVAFEFVDKKEQAFERKYLEMLVFEYLNEHKDIRVKPNDAQMLVLVLNPFDFS